MSSNPFQPQYSISEEGREAKGRKPRKGRGKEKRKEPREEGRKETKRRAERSVASKGMSRK